MKRKARYQPTFEERRANVKRQRRPEIGDGFAGLRCPNGHGGGLRSWGPYNAPCPVCHLPMAPAEAWTLGPCQEILSDGTRCGIFTDAHHSLVRIA